jgi:hypothetical protein
MSPLTTDPNDPRLGRGVDTKPEGMNEVYLVLSEEERAKGFVRPFRNVYQHVGPPGPKYELRDLTAQERERWGERYAKFEEYPDADARKEAGLTVGRFWKQEQLDKVGKGCGSETRMGTALSETYARQPTFYGATYCVSCQMHLPVDEFIWVADGERVGS